MLVCGIDIGSTNLKVALFDTDRGLVWLRSEPTPRIADRFGPVTDVEGLTDLIEDMIIKGWTEQAQSTAIAAISTAGVGEDGVYVDRKLKPLAPALPWFDQRAALEAAELSRHDAATPRSGIGMDTTRTAAKWLWSARHLPVETRSASCWISLTDFPLAKWAERPFLSNTLASRTGCFDAAERQWIDQLLQASQAPRLPPVMAASTVLGPVRNEKLRKSGAANDNTRLVVGGHDHPVAAHAIHRFASDARADSIGTANVIYGDAPTFPVIRHDPLIGFMASIEGTEKLACLGVFEFTATVRKFPGGIDAIRHVLAMPTMPGAPHDAHGAEFATERQLLEWATFNARNMLDRLGSYGVPSGPIYATGGWSRSRSLLELRASIFGEPVHAPQEKELTVLGAALLAAKGIGSDLTFETGEMVVEPIASWSRDYDEAYARFANDAAWAEV